MVLRGSLLNNAIMKTSVVGDEVRDRYLSAPEDLGSSQLDFAHFGDPVNRIGG